jgi:hypothetical protein
MSRLALRPCRATTDCGSDSDSIMSRRHWTSQAGLAAAWRATPCAAAFPPPPSRARIHRLRASRRQLRFDSESRRRRSHRAPVRRARVAPQRSHSRPGQGGEGGEEMLRKNRRFDLEEERRLGTAPAALGGNPSPCLLRNESTAECLAGNPSQSESRSSWRPPARAGLGCASGLGRSPHRAHADSRFIPKQSSAE